MRINVFAINLANRTDRKQHIISQFEGKPEFCLTVVTAFEHKIGAYGLWQTVRQVVSTEAVKQTDCFILCEDDHAFTEHYSADLMCQCINNAVRFGADILSGGYSWFADAIQVSDHLFWADRFNGLQFTIIFRKFYQAILDADFGETVITDIFLSSITQNKFVIYPYISVQKEFGYSDVTSTNNVVGYVKGLFDFSENKLKTLVKVRNYYFPI